jgi:hypothetical protein
LGNCKTVARGETDFKLPNYQITKLPNPQLTVVLPASDNGSMPLSLSSKLAPIVLPDADGLHFQLGSLWASRPAVVVFLRHWG